MQPVDFAAIWDMDGTLVDTAELHFAAWKTLCDELGRGFTRDDFRRTFGQRNPEIFQILFGGEFPPDEVDRLSARKEVLYRDAARSGVTLLPGVRPLLEGLQREGVRQAIGSSAPKANLDLIISLTDTAGLFPIVVSGEDTRRGKPDPEVFLIAAERLGIAPNRCVVFEDAIAGVQAAKAGDMKCVAVTFVGHHPEQALREAGADLVVDNLDQVSVSRVRELF
jgi:beta-phosphoglucomutase